MISKYDKINIINNRISNLGISISVLNQEIEILKKIDPIDQETIDGYFTDIDSKNGIIVALQNLLYNLNLSIDQ
jgi:hypothetical protein